jgi:predicted DNA-binding transcriptional regulator AlpA
MTDNRLLDTEAAAKYMNFSKHTLLGWRAKGCGPDYVRINQSTVRYEKTALDRWIDAKRIQIADDKAGAKRGKVSAPAHA